jgi:ABC-type uncharacterized transport system substrate-binding protein
VAESIRMARKLYPQLKKLGVVWNPAEVNSEVTTKLCREVCKELGITLLEANAENTPAVREAFSSLISRGVQGLWIGGDVTVLAAISAVVGPARDARIPVFTCIPGNAAKGALFDLGANYFAVGHRLGLMAGRVLNGEPISKIEVEYAVPPRLHINTLVLKELRDPWKVPPDVLASADLVIDEQGTHEKKPPAPKTGAVRARLAKTWNVHILEYVNIPDVDEGERGVLEGLKDAGIVEGRDFTRQVSNAQGDMATLTGMVDAAVADRADLIITLSTPTLQNAMRRGQGTPTVFTFLADPIAAGAGTSNTEHKPFVTGAFGAGDAKTMAGLIRRLMPNARRAGTMFVPAEVNSVYNNEQVTEACESIHLEVVPMGVNSPSEVPDTALALCGKQIDLICLPTANMTAASFPSIAQAARRAKIPVFAFLTSMADQGATVTLARDYYDMGHDAGGLAARVMRGESPKDIPFRPSTQNKYIYNLDSARNCGLTIPEELLKTATRVIE